jgi:transposase
MGKVWAENIKIDGKKLVKKNGIKRLKCGSLPSKANVKEQRSFYEDKLLPLMDKAKEGKIALLFVDASHFVMGGDFLGYIYGLSRRFVQTASGRRRYNVLGALNFITKKVTTITNDTYITSLEIYELLEKLAVEYANIPVKLILDNARYQKCNLVIDKAAELGIELIYIPAYSPNLNLIERFWKFVKSELRKKYHNQFDVFYQKIDSIIASSDKESKVAIDSLITDKVQLFDDIVPSTVNVFSHTLNLAA